MTSSRNNYLESVLPLLVVVVAVLFAWWMSLAPRPVPASAPEEEFSAERAFEHIALNCTEPQPAGSLNNDRACQYIIDELERLGVETELVLVYDKTGGRSVQRRRAVLGRIRGTNNTRAFAVDAHFDSVPWGPGAADDFSGIAAMLETARALKASPPLMNDIIFVFADQEEFNMGGAHAFRNHPWFDETGVVLGLEARGTSGPAFMFETSPNNGFVVREMARSNVKARANSIMYGAYDRMPFNSDFGQYKYYVAGLNVAYIDNFDHYHTMLDSPENVSWASLQHHGNYTIELARHFGNMPLDDCYAPDVTYFNTIGSHMIVYPLSWGWPLTALALGLFLAVLIYGFGTGRLGPGGVALGFVSLLAASIIAAIPIGLISFWLFQRFREMALYQNNVYALGFVLSGLGIFAIVVLLVRRWIRPQDFLTGALVWWVLGLLLMQWRAPGAANLYLWPLVIGSIYLLVLLWLSPEGGQPTRKALAWSVILALPPLMFVAPMLIIIFYAVTVMISFIGVPLVLLLCGFVTPQLYLPSRKGLMRTSGALVVAGVVLLIVGYIGTLPSPSSPLLNSLAYGVDFNEDRAYWLSGDQQLDEWTSLYIPENSPRVRLTAFLPRDRHEYFKAEAPMPPFEQATVHVHDERIENGRRIIEGFLDSPRDAQRLWLHLESETEVYAAEILGHELDGAERNWDAYFAILPRQGARIRLEVEPDKPLVFSVREESYGLPEFSDFVPRPAYMMPEPNRRLDRRRSLHSEFIYSIGTIDLSPDEYADIAERVED